MAGEGDSEAWSRRERRALQVLANCIGEMLGVRSEAYRNLTRATASDNPLDLHLAQLSFEALDLEVRAEIWRRVQAVAGDTAAPGDTATSGAARRQRPFGLDHR